MEATRHPDPIVRAATDWFVACGRGVSAAEREKFEHWLRADPRHAAVYREIELTWDVLGTMPDEPATAPLRPSRVWKRAWLALPLAAAAAAVLLIWWPSPAKNYHEIASTTVGAIRRLDLPDGSVVQLNTSTAVEVDYAADTRRVSLGQGEAHFTVAKDKSRPFIVSAGGVAIRAVGTAFNVQLGSRSVEVLVTEGRVTVNQNVGSPLAGGPGLGADGLPTSGNPTTHASSIFALRPMQLVAGERAVIPLATAEEAEPVKATVATVAPAEIDQLLAWRDRQLRFVDRPLAEIVTEFNRYNRHQLVIADDRLGAKRFGGTFPADDYANLVRVLQREFGVEAEESGETTVLRLPVEPAAVENR